MITGICYIDIAGAINCDAVRCAQLALPGAFGPYAIEKRTRRRELLDTTIVRIGNEKIPIAINSNSSRGIKFTLAGAPSAFKHVTDSFRQRAELGRWCIGHLVNDQAVILVGVVHLLKISGIELLVRSFNEIRLPNSVVVADVLDAI